MSTNCKTIGAHIKKKRMECGFTQAEVAAMLSVSPSYICQLESGTSKINLTTLSKIADFLNTGIAEFVDAPFPATYHADNSADNFLIAPGSNQLLEFIKSYTRLDPISENYDKIIQILTLTMTPQEKKDICFMLAGYLTKKWKDFLT